MYLYPCVSVCMWWRSCPARSCTTCAEPCTCTRVFVCLQVVEELPCWELYDLPEGQVPVAWAYAFQGLENKVVVYLPGDTPWRPDPRGREIPAPGLCSTPRDPPKVWQPTTAQHLSSEPTTAQHLSSEPTTGHSLSSEPSTTARKLSSETTTTARKLSSETTTTAHSLSSEPSTTAQNLSSDPTLAPKLRRSSHQNDGGEEDLLIPAPCGSDPGVEVGSDEVGVTAGKGAGVEVGSGEAVESSTRAGGVSSSSSSSLAGGGGRGGAAPGGACGSRGKEECACGVNLPAYWWREEDVQRYSNWDKSNLFVAGSRCLSQLVMLIP